MGIKYGYCGDDAPSITWKIDHSTGFNGRCSVGKLNMTLIRTEKRQYPSWTNSGQADAFLNWINSLTCGDDHIPKSCSLSVQLVEVYSWRPKKVDVIDVINYNKPCSTAQLARKAIRMYLTVGMSGLGSLSSSKFESALNGALLAAEEMCDDMSLDVESWTAQACAGERPLNDWSTYSISYRALIKKPSALPYWTIRSQSADQLDNLGLSTLTTSEVVYFPDQSPTATITENVVNILRDRANVLSCQ